MENIASQLPTKEKRTRNPTSTTCPKCSSDDTRSFEMVNSEGTSTGTFAAGSYTFDVGVTLTQGKTSNQSVLASRTQPPEKPSIKFGAMLFVWLVHRFDDSLELRYRVIRHYKTFARLYHYRRIDRRSIFV